MIRDIVQTHLVHCLHVVDERNDSYRSTIYMCVYIYVFIFLDQIIEC